MGFDIPGLSRVRKALSKDRDRLTDGHGLEGRVLDGRFEILRRLGAGGMGSVYLARQKSMDRDVAVKVLNPDKTEDKEARHRFRVEAAAVSRLRNPHTISVYDFGEDRDGGLFLVMELLDGSPLSEILSVKGTLPFKTAVGIVEQILDSLHEAHRAGVLHRDLKPENVFVTQNPDGSYFVKVLDFGIAKVMGGSVSSRTWAGVVFGTPAYMSPEQVMGRELDARTDLYAVAVMLFQMLVGRLPVSGKSPLEIGIRKVRTRPPRLDEAAPDLDFPRGAADFLDNALDPDREKRPRDTDDFRRRLRAAFDVLDPSAPPSARSRPEAGNGSPVAVATENGIQSGWKYDGGQPAPPVSNRGDPTPGLSGDGISDRVRSSERPVSADVISESPLSAHDRRIRRRTRKLASARVYYDGRRTSATISDLSGTGAFLHSSWLPVVGHRLTVSMTCPGTLDYNISIVAEVVRISEASGASGEIKGFAVRWQFLKARCSLSCIRTFMETMLGKELETTLPESTGPSLWEYSFEQGKFV